MLEILRQGAQSWGIKVIFGIIIAVFVLAFGMNKTSSHSSSTVALVNDAPISFPSFQQRLQRSMETARAQNPKLDSEALKQMGFKRQILDQMVVEQLMLQEANELGITVSDEELASEIHAIPAFRKADAGFDADTYRNVLRANNYNPGQFEIDYRRGMVMNKLQQYVGLAGGITENQARDFYTFGRSSAVVSYALVPWEEFKDHVNATEAQITDYYTAHKADFAVPAQARISYLIMTPETLANKASVQESEISAYYDQNKDKFKIDEQVQASHLLIRVAENATEADLTTAQETIKKAQQEIASGKTFEDVAGRYSEDTGSAQQGGALGWFGRGRMIKPFEDAAFNLPVGTVSDPVRTVFGLHLIKVTDHKKAGYEELAAVADRIRGIIAADRAAETLQDRLDQSLEILMAGGELKTIAETIGLELKVQESAPFTRAQGPAELADLSEDNKAAIFNLAENATTQSPLQYKDGYVVVTKTEQKPDSTKPLTDVKDVITARLLKEEAMNLAKAEAEKKLAAVNAGSADITTTDTQPFGRQGMIQGLGSNPTLANAAFLAKPGQWLPDVYAVTGGYILARAVSVTPPNNDAWNTEKQFWMSSLGKSSEQSLMQAFIADLRAKANIQITNQAILDD